MSPRGFVGAVAVILALVGGFLVGQRQAPDDADRDRAGRRALRVDLTEQVLQPPDASELGRGAARGAVAPTAAGTAFESVSDLVACASTADGIELCQHGSEDPPPGVDPRRLPSVAQLKARRFGTGSDVGPAGEANGRDRSGRTDEAGTAAADDTQVVTPEEVERAGTVSCIGDGSSGPRVQAVYAHASDRSSRYTEVLPLIQQYAADASDRLNYAAGRSGEGRVVRYVTTGSPCVLDVANVTLSRTGDDTFGNTVAELRERGYDRADRKYLVWVDAAVGICGIANVFKDDRPTLDNANTRGNMFARADAPCWGYAELHELLHTLGAVQDSAPHSTKAGHCHDETDAMCYQDDSGAAMQQTCINQPAWNVDCGLNDYFNAAPAEGSYLAERWNAARSPYLHATVPPPPLPGLTIGSAARAFAGNAWRVSATPDLPDGTRTSSFRWTSSRTDCRFDKPSALTTRYWCPVTAAAGGRVRAWLKDSNGAEVTRSQEYRLVVPAAPRRVDLTLTRSATTISAGQTASLGARLSDSASNKEVIGMPVALYRRISGTTRWEKVATRSTSSNGRTSFAVRPARTTDYRVASGSSSTWANGTSATVRITVRR
ncbi:MAG: hypothetical protein ACRDPR_08135 [Nocardioidaceae bacterium]